MNQETQDSPVVNQDTTTEVSNQLVVKANNPSKEDMAALCADIQANHNFKVDVKPVKFNFKKQLDKVSKIETVREAVELAIAFPSIEGIIAIIEGGGKGLELLIETVEGQITDAARVIIADDTEINAGNFPLDKISWEFIANMPKATRRGGGIPKDVWEGFAADYIAIMPDATGRNVEQVTNMAAVFLNKLAKSKTNKPVLMLILEQLSIYVDNSPNAADFAECVDFLIGKAETFLSVSDEELLSAL